MATSVIVGLNALPIVARTDAFHQFKQVERTVGPNKMGGPVREEEQEGQRKSAVPVPTPDETKDTSNDQRASANEALAEPDPESALYRGTQINIYV